MKIKAILSVLFVLLFASAVKIPDANEIYEKKDPPFVNVTSAWVDSVFNSMTLEQKIGQLFVVAVYPQKDNFSDIDNLIKKYHIGGVIYFKGSPTKVVTLTNHFQAISEIPLMTSIDGEWGVGMRLDSVIDFPPQMMLGAISDNRLIYQMGEQIANQCKILGININYAPVIDINNNPANPVIGMRSFGEDKINVAQKGYLYAQALQDNGILAVAKHFPGHGDTDKDSHKTLPIITASQERIDSLELFPFKQLINEGIGGVMAAHLYIPALEKKKNLPSTLSKNIVTELLQEKLGFKGLIFTDALGMKGVAEYAEPGKVEVLALEAGNDILLMSSNVPLAVENIKKAIKSGKIKEADLDRRVKLILTAKYWMGLNEFKHIDTKDITKKLNNEDAILLNRKLIENALTLVKDDNNLLPFKNLQSIKIASVSIGDGKKTVFQDYLKRYTKVDAFAIDKNASQQDFDKLIEKLSDYDYIIVGMHKPNMWNSKTFGFTQLSIDFVDKLALQKSVVLDVFGSPYAVNRFKYTDYMRAIIVSYEDTEESQELSAQLIFGGIPALGRLPVSLNKFKLGEGVFTSQIRLKYTIPAELNINEKYLKNIDSIVYTAIAAKAFPGCQIMAIKDGKVFFQKSYGYHTYKMKHPVEWDDVYDLASITKIMATVPSLMKLYEQGKLDVFKTIGYYLPELDTTNKANLKIIDILTHQARLKPWIPFYKRALNRDGSWNRNFLSSHYSKKFNVKVSDNCYITSDFENEVYKEIYDSPLLNRKRYRYSDLGFYLFKELIEKETGESLDTFVTENFYSILGMNNTCYKPLEHGIPKKKIPPTEYDYKFRKKLVQGYVHDYGAAVLGGVGGHAGLFANANDLAKISQMYLNNGTYAGYRFFDAKTVKFFTKKPFGNSRRALGFDSTDGHGEGPACGYASSVSFGHTGFTGGIVWIDPKYNFIYIFLSNRVYPSAENRQLIDMNIREKIQRQFYMSFLYYAK